MKAVTWQGFRDISVEEVADPVIKEPNDAIIKVISTNICGSDLHLYATQQWPHEFWKGCASAGCIHNARRPRYAERAAVPHCSAIRSCTAGARRQAEYFRLPEAQFTHILVPDGPPDDRFVHCPTYCRRRGKGGVAGVPDGGSLLVLDLGPIGDMVCRIAQLRWIDKIIAVDLVAARLERALAQGVQVIDLREHEDDLREVVRELKDGRGPDSVIDAVGMEAHGSPGAAFAERVAAHLPDAVTRPLMKKVGLDRLAAVYTAIETVRRGGTVSLSGVYGGMADPMPMMSLFDKQIQLRMGQANVKRWIPDIMPFLSDEDQLGVDEFATHRLSLADAAAAYEMFQRKADGAVKIMLKPWA